MLGETPKPPLKAAMPRRLRHPGPLALAAALALALAVPAPALADGDAHAQAEEQFRQAREAQNKGDFRRALDLLRASQAAEPGRGKLVNMAICEEKLGLVGSALRHLEEVLPQLQAGDERLPIVRKSLAQIRPRVPVLRLELAAGMPDHVRIKLDDEALPVAKLGTDLTVDPGKHTVTLAADGRADTRQEVELKEQDHRTLRLEAGPATGAPEAVALPAPPADEPQPGLRRRLAGLVLGGAGAAGLVIGVGTGIVSLVDHGSATSGCPTHVGCSQSVLDKASQGKALAAASTAAFVGGAVLAGVGVYLVISGRAAQPKATVGLTGVLGGARVEGSF